MTDTPTDTAPEAITQAESLDDKVAPFVESYEFRHDDGGAYTPNDADRAMLEDALHGFIADHVPKDAHRRLTSHSAGEGLREAVAGIVRKAISYHVNLASHQRTKTQSQSVDDAAVAVVALLTPPSDAGSTSERPGWAAGVIHEPGTDPDETPGSTTRSGGEGVRLPEITDLVVDYFGHGPFASVDFSSSEVRELWGAFVSAFALATTSSPDASPDSGETGHRNIHGEPIPDVPLTPYADPDPSPAIVKEAGEVERLREALEPFADALGDDDRDEPDHTSATLVCGRSTDYSLDLGDFRNARAALSASNAAQVSK